MQPQLLDIATREVITISEEATLGEAVHYMQERNLRDIVVIRHSLHRYGLLTPQDLIRFKLNHISFNTPLSALKLDTIHTLNQNKTLMEAFEELDGTCKCICLVDEQDTLTGFISYTDIISSIDPALLMREQKLRDILWETMVRHTPHNTPTYDIFQMIYQEGHDSVIIYKEDKPVGIITTKDVVRLLHEEVDLSVPVELHMSTPLVTLSDQVSVQEALDFLKEKHFKRVIICNAQGTITGKISQSELLAKVYSHWAEYIKKRDSELEVVNRLLEEKASRYEHLAQVDKLTGIYNRSRFEKSVISEIERASRHGDIFSIILFDIDHFKHVNDTYGHLAGDVCLQQVAKIVHAKIRTLDTFARWGGEEFVLVLPQTQLTAANIAAEKFRLAIEEYVFKEIGHVTCSFGVSQYIQGDSITSLIHRADKAMYQAKLNGRNRVVTCADLI